MSSLLILLELHRICGTEANMRQETHWAVIKQTPLNNLPWLPNSVPQKTVTCQLFQMPRRVGCGGGKENTKWRQNELVKELLQGSIYIYPSRAGAVGGGGSVSILEEWDTVICLLILSNSRWNGSGAFRLFVTLSKAALGADALTDRGWGFFLGITSLLSSFLTAQWQQVCQLDRSWLLQGHFTTLQLFLINCDSVMRPCWDDSIFRSHRWPHLKN